MNKTEKIIRNVSIVAAILIVLFVAAMVILTRVEFTYDAIDNSSEEIDLAEEKVNSLMHMKKYDVFYPTCDADMIWDPGDLVESEYVIPQDAIQGELLSKEVYTYPSELSGRDEEYPVPYQFEYNGHTYIRTRIYYPSQNAYEMTGRACWQLYDLNNEKYYYVSNVINPRFEGEIFGYRLMEEGVVPYDYENQMALYMDVVDSLMQAENDKAYVREFFYQNYGAVQEDYYGGVGTIAINLNTAVYTMQDIDNDRREELIVAEKIEDDYRVLALFDYENGTFGPTVNTLATVDGDYTWTIYLFENKRAYIERSGHSDVYKLNPFEPVDESVFDLVPLELNQFTWIPLI